MKLKIRLFIQFLSFLFTSYCSVQWFDNIFENIKVSDFNEKYVLYDKKGKEIGKAANSLKYNAVKDHYGNYKAETYLRVKNWLYHDHSEDNFFEYSHEVILDNHFKIIRFKGYSIEDTQKKERHGYYKKPYFYVFSSEKDIIYNLPDGIFSSFIVYYIISNEKFKNISSFRYDFFNLISLDIQTEEITYKGTKVGIPEFNLNMSDQDKLLRVFKVESMNERYQWIFFYNRKNILVNKIDFDGLVVWKNINF